VICEGDIVARLGGDEFAVIQSEAIQPQPAINLAARLVDLIGRAYDCEPLHLWPAREFRADYFGLSGIKQRARRSAS
jgi:GGDEF domain-containing protein